MGFRQLVLNLLHHRFDMRLPDRLPESGKNAALFRWMNQLRASVASLVPVSTVDMKITRSSAGTSSRPTGGRTTTTASDSQPVWQ